MKRCIAVFGPTASGKSSLAIQLAKALDGVIISADSMQIYKGMDIGTAKPEIWEQELVPHKMIDICTPKDSFSVYDYKRMAEEEIERAISLGKAPIIVGGTGLYFDALFFNTDFGEIEIDPKIRSNLSEQADKEGCESLLEKLRSIDPESAAPLHVGDRKRILRALEVYYSTGKTLHEFKLQSHKDNPKYQFLKLFLNFKDRANLYEKINRRVDLMIENGLLEETKRLLSKGHLSGDTARQAIGYKELLPHLTEGKELEPCIETLKQKTRNYAKRQITWFRRYNDAISILMDENPNILEYALEESVKFLRRT